MRRCRRPDLHRIEYPAVNGIGTVRSIAKAYGVFATGGQELNIRPESLAALTAPAAAPSSGRKDRILHAEVSYSHGFCKPSQVFRFGSSERAFGMPGVGGSFGYADPDLELGYAYALNRLGYRFFDDPREKALRDAVHRSVSGRGGTRGTTGGDVGERETIQPGSSTSERIAPQSRITGASTFCAFGVVGRRCSGSRLRAQGVRWTCGRRGVDVSWTVSG
jgi:Beta-lactamase